MTFNLRTTVAERTAVWRVLGKISTAMNVSVSSSTTPQLLASLSVSPAFADEDPAKGRPRFDAPERGASRDTGASIATAASTAADRFEALYEAARRRPQMAAGAAAAVALAAGVLLHSTYGRGLLAVGSGYAAERLFGAGLKRRATKFLTRKLRRH